LMFDPLHGPSRSLASTRGHATVQTTIPARLSEAAPHGADGFRLRSTYPTGSRRNVEICRFGALES